MKLALVRPVADGEELPLDVVEALGLALGEAMAAQFARENRATEDRMATRSGFGQQEDRDAD